MWFQSQWTLILSNTSQIKDKHTLQWCTCMMCVNNMWKAKHVIVDVGMKKITFLWWNTIEKLKINHYCAILYPTHTNSVWICAVGVLIEWNPVWFVTTRGQVWIITLLLFIEMIKERGYYIYLCSTIYKNTFCDTIPALNIHVLLHKYRITHDLCSDIRFDVKILNRNRWSTVYKGNQPMNGGFLSSISNPLQTFSILVHTLFEWASTFIWMAWMFLQKKSRSSSVGLWLQKKNSSIDCLVIFNHNQI